MSAATILFPSELTTVSAGKPYHMWPAHILCRVIVYRVPFLLDHAGPSARMLSLQFWSHVLCTQANVPSIQQQAQGVASRIVSDLKITLSDQDSMWGKPVSSVLRFPLPFDTSCPTKRCVLLEGLESADPVGASTSPLFERVWEVLRLATLSTAKRNALLLLLGVSGAGKTKVAFDIGRKHALLIFAPVHEKGEAGSLTRPWELLVKVLGALRVQSQTASRASRASGTAPIAADVASPFDDNVSPESTAAVAVIIVLLACYVEWVGMVCSAACEVPACIGVSGAGGTVADINALIREVAVRAQRNGTAFDNVHDLFCVRLLKLMGESGLSDSGRVSLSIDTAMRALARAEALLSCLINPTAKCPVSQNPPLPAFVCIDEIGALLEHPTLDGLFRGTFAEVADAESAGTSRIPATAPQISASQPSGWGSNIFPALIEDLRATRSIRQGKLVQGLFYGVLVALRHVTGKHAWGHLLCGTNMRLDTALLNAHSPAQGVSECMDVDTHLDVNTLREWLRRYLTEHAMAGVDDSLLGRLVGRPLYASLFWVQLQGGLSPDGAVATSPFDAATFVRSALIRAIKAAGNQADVRISALWSSSFEIISVGTRPNLLLAWLYYLQRMGWGSETSLSPPSCSAEVMDAVTRGVLHIRRDQSIFNLAAEPITMESILRVGDLKTAQSSLSTDLVLGALARRVSGVFGDESAKGHAAEDVISWVLLRSCMRTRILLRDLLVPFLSEMAYSLFPHALDDHTVELSAGLHCANALGDSSSSHCFLDLLARPGGQTLLLHHTQEAAAGADMAFEAWGPRQEGELPRRRLVLLQIRNRLYGTLAKMLPTVDLGTWYPDKQSGEVQSHKALRAVMADHPDWSDPIRILCSARGVADGTILDAAWMNTALVPQQPLLFLHFTNENTGATSCSH
jgi:hypothetical protein